MRYLFVLFLLLFSTNNVFAQQQPVCDDRDTVVEKLSSKYGEFSIAIGVSRNGSLMELYASKKETWSVTLTNPAGVMCVMTTGGSLAIIKSLDDLKAPKKTKTNHKIN